jgi:hypothetical protein
MGVSHYTNTSIYMNTQHTTQLIETLSAIVAKRGVAGSHYAPATIELPSPGALLPELEALRDHCEEHSENRVLKLEEELHEKEEDWDAERELTRGLSRHIKLLEDLLIEKGVEVPRNPHA